MGNNLTAGVGNYLIAPLGNYLTLRRLRLGNYLIVDTFRGLSGQTAAERRLRELQKLQLGSFSGPAARFRQRTEVTAVQHAILAQLQLAEPPRLQEITPATAAS